MEMVAVPDTTDNSTVHSMENALSLHHIVVEVAFKVLAIGEFEESSPFFEILNKLAYAN